MSAHFFDSLSVKMVCNITMPQQVRNVFFWLEMRHLACSSHTVIYGWTFVLEIKFDVSKLASFLKDIILRTLISYCLSIFEHNLCYLLVVLKTLLCQVDCDDKVWETADFVVSTCAEPHRISFLNQEAQNRVLAFMTKQVRKVWQRLGLEFFLTVGQNPVDTQLVLIHHRLIWADNAKVFITEGLFRFTQIWQDHVFIFNPWK